MRVQVKSRSVVAVIAATPAWAGMPVDHRIPTALTANTTSATKSLVDRGIPTVRTANITSAIVTADGANATAIPR
jgi:hypothetical protein